jgi:hypothetical protein
MDDSSSAYLGFLKSPKNEIILPYIDTLMRSAPDSILLGTAFLALLTQSWSYTVLLLAFVEIFGIHYLLSTLASFITGSKGEPDNGACGFMIPSYSQISIIKNLLFSSSFPIAPTFFVSSVIAYIFGSTINLTNEINDLAKNNYILNTRYPISVIASVVFLSAFVIWRIMRGCDSLIPSLGTVILGFLTGGMLLIANVYIFGREAINFTGLPLLVNKISSGAPLYVCAESSTG